MGDRPDQEIDPASESGRNQSGDESIKESREKEETEEADEGSLLFIIENIINKAFDKKVFESKVYFSSIGTYINNAQDFTVNTSEKAYHKEPDQPQVPSQWPESAIEACQHDPFSLAFFVVAAVLDGFPERSIVRNANMLADKLVARRPPNGDQERYADINPATNPSSKLTRMGLIRFCVGSVGHLRFEGENWAKIVLQRAVGDFELINGWREDFTNWLKQLGADRNVQIRLAAGRAAADIGEITGELPMGYINAWVYSRSALPTDAVDAALTLLLNATPTLADLAKDKLYQWARGVDDSDHLYVVRRVAARYVGVWHLSIALNLLTMLVTSQSSRARAAGTIGLQQLLKVNFSTESRLKQIIREINNIIRRANSDGRKEVSTAVMVACLGAADSSAVDSDDHKQTMFEHALKLPEGPSILAPLYAQVARTANGVGAKWRDHEKRYIHRALARPDFQESGILKLARAQYSLCTVQLTRDAYAWFLRGVLRSANRPAAEVEQILNACLVSIQQGRQQ